MLQDIAGMIPQNYWQAFLVKSLLQLLHFFHRRTVGPIITSLWSKLCNLSWQLMGKKEVSAATVGGDKNICFMAINGSENYKQGRFIAVHRFSVSPRHEPLRNVHQMLSLNTCSYKSYRQPKNRLQLTKQPINTRDHLSV
jgi:hypothetical protein